MSLENENKTFQFAVFCRVNDHSSSIITDNKQCCHWERSQATELVSTTRNGYQARWYARNERKYQMQG